MHFPVLWKFRLLRALKASGRGENRRLFQAWARAEGGWARFNPLNTTQTWPDSTDYNSAGVQNYRTGSDGIAATAKTLDNGLYDGILHSLRHTSLTAEQMVEQNAAQFDKWGTGTANILAVLRSS